MKYFKACFFLLLVVCSLISCGESKHVSTYSVAKATKNGEETIYRFISQVPDSKIVERYKWLTVISWKYDKAEYMGMPNKSEQYDMNNFEDAIFEMLENTECGINVYVKTGVGKREFVYYIEDREKFTSYLNAALAKHKVYPIKIEFFEDPTWSDFKKLISSVAKSS